MNLEKRLIDEIIKISCKYEYIKKVILFGSRARGDNGSRSDIDLAIYSEGSMAEFIEGIEMNTHTLLEFDFSDMNSIKDELVWISLLEDRNSTSHIYNEKLADEIAERIVNKYVGAIGELVLNLEKLK